MRFARTGHRLQNRSRAAGFNGPAGRLLLNLLNAETTFVVYAPMLLSGKGFFLLAFLWTERDISSR